MVYLKMENLLQYADKRVKGYDLMIQRRLFAFFPGKRMKLADFIKETKAEEALVITSSNDYMMVLIKGKMYHIFGAWRLSKQH